MATTGRHGVTRIRGYLASSRLARAAAFPGRARIVARHDLDTVRGSLRWLLRSREHTNFTYPLTPLNQEHLAWFVAAISGVPTRTIRSYFDELLGDEALIAGLLERQGASARSGLMDQDMRFGRRLGWYALVRCCRPSHVVETGTDKGLGSVVLAAALLRNGTGRLTTVDVNEAAGQLIGPPYTGVIDQRFGDALAVLRDLGPTELFIHDSLHTPEHERAELDAVRLTPTGLALSDNSHATGVLPAWAEERGMRFLYFQERPDRHWYPGAGIGVAWSDAAEP